MEVKSCLLILVCLGLASGIEATGGGSSRRIRSRYYSSGCPQSVGTSGCFSGQTNGGYSSGYSAGSSYSSQSSYSSSSSQAQQQAGQLEIGQQLLDNEYDDVTETELIDHDQGVGETLQQRTVTTVDDVQQQQQTSAEGTRRRTRWRTIPVKGQGHESSWSSRSSWSSQSQLPQAAQLPTLPPDSEIESLLQGLPEGVNITKKGSLGPGHSYYYQRRVYNWTSGARPVGCTSRTCNVDVIRTTGGQKASSSRGTQYIQTSRNKGNICGAITGTTSNCVFTTIPVAAGASEELVQQPTEVRPPPTPAVQPTYYPPPTYLPAPVPTYQPAYQPAPVPTYQPAPVQTYQPAYQPAPVPTYQPIPTYQPVPTRPIPIEKGPPAPRPPPERPARTYYREQQTTQQQRATYQQESRPISHIPAPRPTRPDYSRPEIQCTNGVIRGQIITTATGREVYAFLGVPFARPPTGNLRFRRPEPVDNWEEPIDATQKPPACPQVNASSFPGNPGEAQWNPATVSEDCLYLNIWIPASIFRSREQRLSDILFWIYGGGFFSGSSSLDIYDGAILACENDIIVVSTQYRVGPLGFLFLDDGDAPGNMGMLDQVAALKWVNTNIRYFGGNPDSITLIGESAGSVSVNLHLLSPASRGLFNRAVLMSGVATAPFATVSPAEAQRLSLDLAAHVGCDTSRDRQEIIQCLRSTDAGVLTAAQFQFFSSVLKFPFVVTIDREFLPSCPSRLMETNTKRADVMVGNTKDEGSYFLIYQYLRQLGEQRNPQISRQEFVDMITDSHRSITTQTQSEAISTYYTNWKNPEDGRINVQRLSDSISDGYFVCHSRQFADQWSEKGNAVYQYYFTQRTSTNPWPEWAGVMHADDIEYFFGVPLRHPERFTEDEQQLSIHMMRLLCDFAKSGVPARSWTRYTERRPTFLELNANRITEEVSAELGPRANECAFWSKILPTVSVAPGCQSEDESENLLQRYLSNVCTSQASGAKVLNSRTRCSARTALPTTCQ